MAWEELTAIVADTMEQVLNLKSTPPQACPQDGEPLLDGPNGVKYCRYDGWQWPRDDWSAR